MKVVLSNKAVPSNGVASIPLPIPKAEYDNCLSVLAALDIGDVLLPDCKVEEISDEYPILKRLEGSEVNVDELDYLVKRLESFDKQEMAQFGALAVTQDVHSMKDYINLTFCCQNITVVQDFSDLKQIGAFCLMDRNGGSMTSEDMLSVDFREIALNLLQNENGKITPYGVIYDKDFQMEQLYDGRHFPQYHYEDCVMEVEITTAEDIANDVSPACFYLPMSEQQLERAMQRNHFTDCDNIELRFMESALPEDVEAQLDFTEERIHDLNALCQAVANFSEKDMAKYQATMLFTQPGTAVEFAHLAQHIHLFDLIPNIHTPEEYGKHMIMESGKFEYDENLEGYYNFEKYGLERMEQEHGQFNNSGYISYNGVVSLSELLGGVDCERMDTGMQMGCM